VRDLLPGMLPQPAYRSRIVGRRVAPTGPSWPSFRSYRGPHQQGKARWLGDKLIPPGFRHTSLARIPKTDWTSRLLQDQIDESMRRQIAHEPPGPRRAFLLRDYELWLANGKPTYYSPGKSAHGREGRKEASAVRTWARGKPAFWDFIDDNERKGERQFLRR